MKVLSAESLSVGFHTLDRVAQNRTDFYAVVYKIKVTTNVASLVYVHECWATCGDYFIQKGMYMYVYGIGTPLNANVH